MILIAFEQNWSLLVNSDPNAVIEAFLAKPSATFLIVEVLAGFFTTSHTPESILHLHVALMAN